MKKSKRASRERDFAFILYPESANPKWKQILSDLKLPVFWVFHDKDTIIDEKTGVGEKFHSLNKKEELD